MKNMSFISEALDHDDVLTYALSADVILKSITNVYKVMFVYNFLYIMKLLYFSV